MILLSRLTARAAALVFAAALALAPAAASQSSIVTPTAGPHSMADFTGNFLNPALQAMASCFSGASAPNDGPGAAPVQYQCWVDTSTTPATYRFYDGASWVAFGTLDATNHLWKPSSNGATLRLPSTGANPLFFVNGDTVGTEVCGPTGALTCQPGSDSNSGLSNSAPFATVQAAINAALNNWDGLSTEIVINLAHGSYANYGGWVCASHNVGGLVDIRVRGDTTNQTAVSILAPNGGVGAFVKDECIVIFDSLNFADAGSALQGAYISQDSGADFKNVHWGAFNSSAQHILIDKGGVANIITNTIDGGAGAFAKIRNGTLSVAQTNAPPVASTIAIPSAVAFTKFIDAAGPSTLANFGSSTFTGAGVAGTTGVRAALAGPVYLQGGGAACNSIFPGNANCQITQGAQDDALDAATTPPPGVPSTGTLIGRQTFCASGCTSTGGTYTPTPGTNVVDVQVLGGGGGGGGCPATGAAQGCIGGSGGSGSYSRKRIASSFSGVTVTAGAAGAAGTTAPTAGGVGGASSFGSLVTAAGGAAGFVGAASSVNTITTGSGGTTPPTLGDVNIAGTSSYDTPLLSTSVVQQATPGESYFGQGSRVKATATSIAGAAASTPGAGGTGAAVAASASAAAGATGGAGIVIVDEYQ